MYVTKSKLDSVLRYATHDDDIDVIQDIVMSVSYIDSPFSFHMYTYTLARLQVICLYALHLLCSLSLHVSGSLSQSSLWRALLRLPLPDSINLSVVTIFQDSSTILLCQWETRISSFIFNTSRSCLLGDIIIIVYHMGIEFQTFMMHGKRDFFITSSMM